MKTTHPPTNTVPRRQALGLLAALALSTLGRSAWAQSAPALDHNYAAWDALLKKHVRWLPDNKQSRVNYKSLGVDRAELKKVLAEWSAVSAASFASLSREQQMAFLINTYNGFTLELILSK